LVDSREGKETGQSRCQLASYGRAVRLLYLSGRATNGAWHHRTLNASDWLQRRHMQPFSERDEGWLPAGIFWGLYWTNLADGRRMRNSHDCLRASFSTVSLALFESTGVSVHIMPRGGTRQVGIRGSQMCASEETGQGKLSCSQLHVLCSLRAVWYPQVLLTVV